MTARILAVVGPTASGKTELGLAIAERIGAEIISADSRQIYRLMDIGTAKPSVRCRSRVPHHFIDIFNPDQIYSAGEFAIEAAKLIDRLHQKGKPVVVVGGTGLYVRSLLDGITRVPDTTEETRQRVRSLIDQKGLISCFHELVAFEPRYGQRLHPNDIARITRALEIKVETGRSIFDFEEEQRAAKPPYKTLFFGLGWQRQQIYHRINQRVIQMIDHGLVEEVESILAKGYNDALPPLRTIGYKEVIAYLNGEYDKEVMVGEIQKNTRHYAKKQFTWYQKDDRVHWIEPNASFEHLHPLVDDFLSTPDTYNQNNR